MKALANRWMAVALGAVVLAIGPAVRAAEPVDPDLSPEARKVLAYLESVYGKKTLSGMSSYGGWRSVFEASGRAPAVYSLDAFGWNKPKWGASYRRVLQGAIDGARTWWQKRGGIVSMQFHWGKPGDPNGSAWVGGGKGTGPVDVAKTVTPGTPEHKAAMEDLRRTADYLEQLAKARVPVLWRPFHEIDGGWFWWTDTKRPENTAALWRMMFDYLVKERGLHNLIWVYSAGLKPGNLKRGAPLEEEIPYRKRFYPGERYVDISGIDIYPNSYYGWGPVQEDTYGKALEIMRQVSPGKMLALCESAAIPNPDLMQKWGPAWLYCLPWFAGGRANPADWIRKTFAHDFVVTLDELPPLGSRNVAPTARLVRPADGAALAGGTVEIEVQAADRNGNLAGVEFYLLPGPWKNWFLRGDDDMEEAMREARRLGEAKPGPDGRATFTWRNAPIGCHDIVALARDADGATSLSNVSRVTVGLENLARGKQAKASSDAQRAGVAVDGDLFTSWSGAKEGPQWLAADLGAAQQVGAVVVSWWKAYAKAYQIQISIDGAKWRDVFRTDTKRLWHGDADVIRFQPTQARYVRLYCTERGTNWGGYSVYELAVFASIP